MLTEKDTIQVEVTESDHVQVRVRTIIYRDGEPISSSLNRRVITPGQDYSGEVRKVRRMAQAAHIPVVVAKYQAEQEYEAAKTGLDTEDNAANRAIEKRLKKIRDLKRQEYEDFEAE